MDVELLFTRGREAADRGNYDYAIAVFRDILREAPDHVNSRITLRGCEMARFQERGGGVKAKLAGFFAGLVPLVMLHVAKTPQKKMEWAERYLEKLPTPTYVLKKLAKACQAAGYLEAGVNTLEFARQRKPENAGVLQMLAEMYAEKQDYKRASRCYEELEKLRPNDRMIPERLRNLRAADHLQSTKLEESKSYREQIRDEEQAKEIEQGEHIVRTTDDVDAVIARCQARLREKPDDVEALVKLGDMYARTEQDKFAFAAYNKAFEMTPRYNIKVKIGDLKIRQLKKAEEAAAEAAKREPLRADLQARARQARQARVELAIKEFDERYRDHPTEMALAHQLGFLHSEKGGSEAMAKAIEYFQKSVEDPRFKPQARFMLGQCFGTNPKTRDTAISQYEQALTLVISPTGDIAKTIQYNLGLLHEQAGNKEKALEWYKKVLAVDASFRDVRQKIEQLS
jgi:tetratricopeptide (TPR) repeat protein